MVWFQGHIITFAWAIFTHFCFFTRFLVLFAKNQCLKLAESWHDHWHFVPAAVWISDVICKQDWHVWQKYQISDEPVSLFVLFIDEEQTSMAKPWGQTRTKKKKKKEKKDIDRTLKLAELRSRVKVEVAVLVSLSLIVLTVSVDVKQCIVQELCESWGGCPGLSVLTSLLVSVDVNNYCTVLRHWSQLVPNMSTDIWGH